MSYDTKITIGGNSFVTDKATALSLYELLASNVMLFSEYSNDMLEPLIEHNLNMSPLDSEFNEDILAAKTLGVTFSEFYRDKRIKTH